MSEKLIVLTASYPNKFCLMCDNKISLMYIIVINVYPCVFPWKKIIGYVIN